MHKYAQVDEATIMMLIGDIAKLFHDNMRKYGDKMGISAGYRHILFHLEREDGITQLDLVNFTHYKAPSVSATLKNMESDGLIVRYTDTNDMRQTRVFITDKGRDINSEIKKAVDAAENEFVKNISDDEISLAKSVLIKIRENAFLL